MRSKQGYHTETPGRLDLSRWPYIRSVAFTGDLQADAATLLTVNGKPKTAAHSLAVANTSRVLAARFGLDAERAAAAALLHDSSNIIKPRDMLAFAVSERWAIDPAEREHPFLLHQRLSAVLAQALFTVNDEAVVSAVACHSTLKPGPSDYDMALFLADKLSWDQEGAPPFYDAVSQALDRSLRYASLTYINFVLENSMILSPHRWLLEAKRWLEEHL